MTRTRAAVLCAIAAACVGAQPLPAQDRAATLAGAVRAPDGRPLAGATVILVGTPLRATTDAQGTFRFDRLAPGRYSLRIVAPGFDSATREGLSLTAGATRRVEVTLAQAAVPLPGIVVTASRSAAPVGETPASVAVVTDSAIARRSAVTVADALPFVPGVIFNAGQIDIRGATGLARGVGSRVLLLLDGHRVLAAADGGTNYDLLPILDIDRVEVVKGPQSTLYGSNALGGVINVITRPTPEHPRTVVKTHLGLYDTPGRFAFTDETLSRQGIDVEHARRLGPVGATLTLGRKTSDGFRENGDHSRWLVRGKVDVGTARGAPWTLHAVWARDDHGEFFTWRSASEPLRVDPPEALGDWVRSDKLNVGATLTPVATAGLLLQVRPHVHRNAVQNHFHDNRDFHRSTRLGTEVQASFTPRTRHAATAGTELVWTRVRSNFLGEPEITDLAAFVQDEVALTDRLRLTAGLRVDHRRAEASESEFALSPKVGLVVAASPRVSYRVSLGRGYRAPTAVEQFVSTTFFTFRVVPNPELRGETAWSGEAGVRATLWDRLHVDAALFHSEYYDLIEPAQVPGQLFTFQFRNVARARVRGLDLGLDVGVVRERLTLAATYTYLDADDVGRDQPLPYRSRHNVTATLDAGLAALDLRYRSQVERVLVYPLDPRGAVALLDLRAGYRLLTVDVQLKVTNLLQETYVDVQERNPGESRSVLLTAVRRF